MAEAVAVGRPSGSMPNILVPLALAQFSDSNDPVDPKLRATTEVILAMPVDDRLRQLEAESSFFSSIRPLDC
jgi:hypothetical protein